MLCGWDIIGFVRCVPSYSIPHGQKKAATWALMDSPSIGLVCSRSSSRFRDTEKRNIDWDSWIPERQCMLKMIAKQIIFNLKSKLMGICLGCMAETGACSTEVPGRRYLELEDMKTVRCGA